MKKDDKQYGIHADFYGRVSEPANARALEVANALSKNTMNSIQKKKPYGKELILDLHDCDPKRFNRATIKKFFREICESIDMQRCELFWWDDYGLPKKGRQTEPHLKGTSAVQFIMTSNITIHTLDILKSIYLNIFSCKDFDAKKSNKIFKRFFQRKDSESDSSRAKMKIITLEQFIPKKSLSLDGLDSLKQCYETYLSKKIQSPHRIIRFVVTKSDKLGYHCEIDSIIPEEIDIALLGSEDIFDFRKRSHENTDKFTTVLLIPTGIGAKIGGHCGDGNSIARLLAAVSDVLITHPNVVNASDINEMTDNTEYVEGSILSRFLLGKIGLQKVRSNKILMLMDKHPEKFFNDEIINAVSSARITLGMDCDVYEMENLIESISQY